MFVVHEKAERRAMGAAAEAVKELLHGAYAEGRGFFVVERTAGHEFPPLLLERYALVDHLDDVDAAYQLVNETLWNARHV